MDLQTFQYLYNWNDAVRQRESVPFIGDAVRTDSIQFDPVEDKTLSVLKIEMGEQKITVHLAVQVGLNRIHRDYDSIIVGAQTNLLCDHHLKDIPIEWIAVNRSSDLKMVPSGLQIGPMQINHFNVQAKGYLKTFNTAMDFQFSCFLERIISFVDNVDQVAKGIIVPSDKKTLDKYRSFTVDMISAVKKHLMPINKVTINTWVYLSYILLKQHDKLQNLAHLIEKELENIESRYIEKRKAVDRFEEDSLAYISSGDSWKDTLKHNEKLYVFMFREHLLPSSTEACELFFKLHRQVSPDDYFCCVLDLDLVPPECVGGAPPKECVIRLYEDGRCTIENFLRHIVESKTNVVINRGDWDPVIPEKRALLRIKCPGFFESMCPEKVHQWKCKACLSLLYYAFDEKIYCDRCGAANLRDCLFSCEEIEHDEDLPLARRNIDELRRLVAMPEWNILLLSQSGVGKSTMVNAVVNYMAYETLDQAKKHDVLAPIPTKFTVTDDMMKVKTIYAGICDDEIETGESVTQKCANYSVLYRKQQRIVNFIDTPGLGDSRGVEKDRENIMKILDHIRFIKELHGICLLLKPNETRITASLSYCLQEILSNLHKSSSNNILVCFTNARSTFYKPGETMPLLIKLLEDIDVKLEMSERTFCFDNESFRYLCIRNAQGITFTPSEDESFSKSWEKSVGEITRLFEHVSRLEPHRTSDTWSLNRARRIILSLIRPIADITMTIVDNMKQWELKKAELESSQQNLGELRNLAVVTQLNLVAKELGYPRTVCTAEKCVKYHTFAKTEGRKTEYVTHCHTHCYLTGVTPEQYPNSDLKNCAAMIGLQCGVCQCSWEHHMHILYDQTVEEIDVHDKKIDDLLRKSSNAATDKEAVLRRLEEIRQEHANEKKVIMSQCAKFAHFLRNNAIVGYNDALGQYLGFLIEREEMKKDKTPRELEKIDKMKETKDQYANEVKIFEDAAREGPRNITPEDIAAAERELYNLPHYGKSLKNVMAVALAAEDNASRHSVHKGNPKQQPTTSGMTFNRNAKKNYPKKGNPSSSSWFNFPR